MTHSERGEVKARVPVIVASCAKSARLLGRKKWKKHFGDHKDAPTGQKVTRSHGDSPLCVEWNEIAIRICRGETRGSPPPWTPQIIVNIWDTTPKFFLRRNMRICWSDRPGILADYTSGRKYKRLEKKGEKWQLYFTSHIIAKNGQNISKIFLVHVLGKVGGPIKTAGLIWLKFLKGWKINGKIEGHIKTAGI